MLFSRDWLAQYVDLPDDPAELGRRLTLAGMAVEQIERKGDDFVLDVEVTTNRPDCMNHLGLAREAAVLYDRPLRRPPASPTETPETSEAAEGVAQVRIEDPVGCPRYAARVVRGVRIGPSPDWLRERLETIGLRSINNVVDVTNFVLWEMGQPLHAFDLARLGQEDGKAVLIVRRARPGERLTTLDGVERELDAESLVIADPERPVALAGVMGGLDTEVTAETRDLLIESAHFDRRSVRVTARKLGLHTDAKHRFERGTDPEMCAEAAGRAAALIAEVAGGTVLAGTVDVRGIGGEGSEGNEGNEPARWHRRGRLDHAKLEAFIGTAIAPRDVERWMTGLGFQLEAAGAGAWQVTVPSWRYFDFEPRPEPPHEVYPQDLYEEVVRIHGFDAIPSALPAIAGSDGPRTPAQARRDRVRRHLAACGYAEAIHFAFQDPAADAAFPSLRPEAVPVALVNPLSERYSVMRRSLVPNLVESARFNQRRGAPAVRLFEIATVFYGHPEGHNGELPDQPEHVGLVCGGRVGMPWDRAVDLDLFDLKGIVESLGEALGIWIEARPPQSSARLAGLLPGNTAELFLGEEHLGYLGRVEAEEGYPLFVAELSMAALGEGHEGLEVEAPSRFPGIDADFTLTHSREVPWEEIRRTIAGLAPPDLVSWGFKDRYQGAGVPEGAVNATMTFLYNSRERSLTREEINARQSALTQELERRFGWRG